MNKARALAEIAKQVENCRVCRRKKTGKAVVGEGHPNAKIAFIGEAPGRQEALAGRPFVGRSGQLLRKTIREVLKLDDLKEVYIASPVKYLPKRGTPSREDIAHGRVHLTKQLAIIDPKVIVLLGNVAVAGVLNEKLPVVKNRGKFIKRDARLYLITYHPAAVLRFPYRFKSDFINDFRKLKIYQNKKSARGGRELRL